MEKQFTKERSLVVKGVAIILLLFYHLFENEHLIREMSVDYGPFSLPGFLMLSGFGNICVAVFVLITSYGISKELFAKEEMTAKAAYQSAGKRFLKLMLNFALLFASVNLLWGTKFHYGPLYGEGWQGLLYGVTDGLGLAHFFETPTMNLTWWYMGLAYSLILLVPLLAMAAKKIGYGILLIAFILPEICVLQPDLERYLFTAVLGVCAAYGKWPERLLSLKCPKVVQWLVGIGALLLCIPIRQNFAIQEHFEYLIDAPIAMLLLFVCGVLLASVPLLNKCLEFLGRHSMNIYLVHTFFYMSLWREYIYHFHSAWVTLALLLASTLVYSVLLELIKKVLGLGAEKMKSLFIKK